MGFLKPKAPKVQAATAAPVASQEAAAPLKTRSAELSSARKRATQAAASRGRSALRIDLNTPSTGTGIAARGRTSLTA